MSYYGKMYQGKHVKKDLTETKIVGNIKKEIFIVPVKDEDGTYIYETEVVETPVQEFGYGN